MITSTSNQQMKNLTLLMKKAKARNEQGVFVAEGRKMFLEAPVEWVKQVYVLWNMYAGQYAGLHEILHTKTWGRKTEQKSTGTFE